MEISELLEQAQEFSLFILRDYGYTSNLLEEQWIELMSHWEITIKTVTYAAVLMDDLQELLGPKLTEAETLRLHELQDYLLRARRRFDYFYEETELYIISILRYGTWLGSELKPSGLRLHDMSTDWMQEHFSLADKASDELKGLLTADNASSAKAELLDTLRALFANVELKLAEAPKPLGTPSLEIAALEELAAILDRLEIDNLVFEN